MYHWVVDVSSVLHSTGVDGVFVLFMLIKMLLSWKENADRSLEFKVNV